MRWVSNDFSILIKLIAALSLDQDDAKRKINLKNLRAVVGQFEFERSISKEIDLKQKASAIENQVIDNFNNPSSYKQTIKYSRTRLNLVKLTTTNVFTTEMVVSFGLELGSETGASAGGLSAENSQKKSFGLSYKRSNSTSNGNEHSVQESHTYAIEKEITVPANTSIMVSSYTSFVDHLSMPFTAKVTFTGHDMTGAEVLDTLKGKDILDPVIVGDTVQGKIKGVMTGSFGLQAKSSIVPISRKMSNRRK